MRMQHLFPQDHSAPERLSLRVAEKADHPLALFARQAPVGVLLIVALLAFEVFNFDTTRFALLNLMGDINFAGLRWASILALAFCAIDFAGLAHLFAPSRKAAISGETWYLMGAWILGATMNAVMTWWAVGLALLSHDLGNELLSREQLLDIVPTFVAVLVWVTRILFIGAFSVAGTHFFEHIEVKEDDGALPYAPVELYDHYELQEQPLRETGRPGPSYAGSAAQPIARGPRPTSAMLHARTRHGR